jgi:hypothetical protein
MDVNKDVDYHPEFSLYKNVDETQPIWLDSGKRDKLVSKR